MPDRDTTVKMEYKEPDESLYSSAEMSIVAGLKRENKRLMEQIYHTQGQMADVVRVVLPFTGYDSCDATYPYIQDFYIPTDAINVISVRAYYKIRPFRAYSKTAEEAGLTTTGQNTTTTTGSSSTTSSGASSTSSSGASSTSTCGDYTGSKTSQASASNLIYVVGGIENDAQGHVTKVINVDVPNKYHTHSVNLDHCHNIQHYHNIEHTHNIKHTHEFAHSHPITDHDHEIVFGIYEKTPTAPDIKVWLSQNGVDFPLFIGESTDDYDFEFATQIKGTGWKSIKFEVNELMQIVSNIIVVADIKVTN